MLLLAPAAHRAAAFALLLTALLTTGCGGDGAETAAEELSDCSVDVGFSGAYSGAISDDALVGCGIPYGGDVGVMMIFLPGDEKISSFAIDVHAVTEGGLGTFPASAALRLPDDRAWSTEGDGCSVEVTEHRMTGEDELAKEYLFVGTGTCAGPAAAEPAGEGDVAVGAFSFRFPALWPL